MIQKPRLALRVQELDRPQSDRVEVLQLAFPDDEKIPAEFLERPLVLEIPPRLARSFGFQNSSRDFGIRPHFG